MNLPGEREKQVAIDADHNTICKFDSIQSGACELVLGVITTQVERALEIARESQS